MVAGLGPGSRQEVIPADSSTFTRGTIPQDAAAFPAVANDFGGVLIAGRDRTNSLLRHISVDDQGRLITAASGLAGTAIATKVDLAIAAVTETAILLGGDIPAGTKRVTIVNIGADTARIKATAEGGGIARGLQLLANQAMSIDAEGGALATLDAFSTLGTTFAFFFERE